MKEIVGTSLKLGATAYGGPAMMGVMPAELQERRQWVSRERFVEGLAIVNMLRGATAAQLGIFLGYARGGWRGGLVGGVCFVLPAFVIMLTLLPVLDRVRRLTWVRAAMKGMGCAVIGVLAVSLLRLTPHALPDALAVTIFGATIVALLVWRVGVIKLLLAGSALGILAGRCAGSRC
ncbi:MAG: chromate transporter [Candidatus Rokubacteria bacterium]|nr:chromate transporter [Candidatus Rokubacteria bacterium]